MKSLQSHLNCMETEIQVPGLPREVSIMHVSDSHLTESDDREDEATKQLAKGRAELFSSHARTWGDYTNRDVFLAHVAMCNERRVNGSVFTGDIIDFPSAANLELMRHGFASLRAPYLFTMGNHDWSFPHLESGDAQRARNYGAFGEWFTRAPGCEILEIGGVKLIAYDNSNYQVTSEQCQRIRETVETGAPCLLFMHIPLYLPSLVEDVVKVWRAPIMMGADDWPRESRISWMGRDTDASTAEFCEWLKTGHSNILGIFCGHVHFAHTDPLGTGRSQYVAEAGYVGGCRIIRLKPLI